MKELADKLLNLESIKKCFQKEKISPITILGLSDISKSCIAGLIKEKTKKAVFVVTYNELQAQKLHKNVKSINPNTIYIPRKDIVTYEYDAQNMDILYSRMNSLINLYNNETEIIIVSIETLMQPIISKKKLSNSILKLMVANEYNIEEIKEKLVNLGYKRYDLVEGKGTFSVRGDILDIAIDSKKGIRIEFFGDEVDQIRYFDISSQRSIENANQIKIYPLSEEIEEAPKGSLLEYFSEETIIVLDEENKIELRANNILNDNKLAIKDLVERNKKVPYVLENMYDINNIFSKIEEDKKVNLESQDIISKKEDVIILEYEEIQKIEEIFANETKQEKEKKPYIPRKRVSKDFKEGERVSYADLKIGDFVVHKTVGIGQYIGVNTIKTCGITKDYIKIKYRGEDTLYIPTDSLDNIRKYIGGGEKAPKLNKLNSKEWENTKNKVKSNLREVARNLIELYATRQKVQGFAFEKDTPWQKEFEETFQYEETEDQLRCIEEVKKDMEKAKPMDRLLCGDVGYGKTEVAIRAAFKACMSGKQVAYLVPTTILANQQYEGFKERMDKFGVKVELLNRFRTKKEQDNIVKELKLGNIDVVIGTHRLLSKDIEFKDLGLLIVDEEHRFGVKDKEKIKEMKANVDVLTMTATPIPRTLHMSIVGVRDMSVIYEPPQDRKPVKTYVLEYDEEVIKEAITRELERNGQIFYLYNKVEGIEKKAERIAKLVPEAKVAYAHGQMGGQELENIMLDFIEKKTNVIVCTTILESGIDIPNANTIIVENADRLGLAQLYQIRGRVGRSNKESFAYITYRRDRLLSEIADKRLKAIKDFTEFGSGFKIALRDLEIRGAGSIIGEIQHGHMEQVGYDMYCKLLDQVMKEMQGQKVEEEPKDKDIQIDINVSSYIPDEYIESSDMKINIYQDIALCRNEEEILDITDEIIDRFGTMPKEVENLLEIVRIKNMCREKKIEKIMQKESKVVFYFEETSFDPSCIAKLLEIYKTNIKFSPSALPYITYKIDIEKSVIKQIKDFLQNV